MSSGHRHRYPWFRVRGRSRSLLQGQVLLKVTICRRWTFEQAVEYFSDNCALSLEEIRNEVRRYILWPGQALGYKIGQLKIIELREKASQALGECDRSLVLTAVCCSIVIVTRRRSFRRQRLSRARAAVRQCPTTSPRTSHRRDD